MSQLPLRVLSFLAPNQLPTQRFVIERLGQRLGLKTEFHAGSHYEEAYEADLSFICGLPYVLRTRPRRVPSPIEAIAAPVLQGDRYQGKPIYFSDVIVHCDSLFQSFGDLRGCTWVYNEPESQSGYGITRYSLVKLGETQGYFKKVRSGDYHQEAIRMVAERKADAAAIDSHVLALELRAYPDLAAALRVIDTLGPSTIQPIAVNKTMPDKLKSDIRVGLTEMHTDPVVKARLTEGLIERYVSVTDSVYNDIRDMLAACEAVDFMELK
jgi:phosphonate transport system substrate-binding protein